MKEMIKDLMHKTESIIEDYKIKNESDKNEFNLFRITGISTDEVKICRMLTEILNPRGKHGMGSDYLFMFMKEVLSIDVWADELKNAKVFREFCIDDNRRIDIVISTTRRFIPIEVKLYADDQDSQCKDYYDYALKQPTIDKSNVYYLTLDSHLPQNDGANGLTSVRQNDVLTGYEEITPISFGGDIVYWLKMCIEITSDNLVTTNLIQFKNVLEELSGNMGNEMNAYVVQSISENEKTFEAACKIAENVNKAKEELLYKVLSAIERKLLLENLPIERITNRFDYKFNNYEAIRKFYSNRKMYPAIVYRCKKIDDSKEIWFMVEVEWNLYCGFVLAENNENNIDASQCHELIKQHINLPYGFNDENWWFYWEYLLDEDDTPNFVYNNETLTKLFDADCFEEFIDKCVKRIKFLLDNMKLK